MTIYYRACDDYTLVLFFLFNFFFILILSQKNRQIFKDPIRFVLKTPATRINPVIRTCPNPKKGLEHSVGIKNTKSQHKRGISAKKPTLLLFVNKFSLNNGFFSILNSSSTHIVSTL